MEYFITLNAHIHMNKTATLKENTGTLPPLVSPYWTMLPYHLPFWGEAFYTAPHLINLLPTQS